MSMENKFLAALDQLGPDDVVEIEREIEETGARLHRLQRGLALVKAILNGDHSDPQAVKAIAAAPPEQTLKQWVEERAVPEPEDDPAPDPTPTQEEGDDLDALYGSKANGYKPGKVDDNERYRDMRDAIAELLENGARRKGDILKSRILGLGARNLASVLDCPYFTVEGQIVYLTPAGRQEFC